MTEKNTTELIQLLSHEDGTERRQAALALGTIKDPVVAPALVKSLRAETPGCGVHEDLTWATVQHIDEALPEVLSMLTDENPHIRRTGAHVLSKVGDPQHLEHLAPLVADEDADVAIKAYRAVANTKRDEAVTTLAGRLGDGDALQRDALTAAFHRFGEKAVPVLVEALASDRAEVREHAADVLGHLGEDAVGAAEALEALTRDGEASVRLAAVSALGSLGEASTDALARASSSEDATVASVAKRFAQARPAE